MQKLPGTLLRIILALVATAGWFALAAQFGININSKLASGPEVIIRYFSYYTILTNILVAACCTILAFAPSSLWAVKFWQPGPLTAIAVYITVVGVVYNIILRFLWNPQGLQFVVDELLHLVIPVAYVLFWLVAAPKNSLKWRDVFPWLIYPLVYFAFILLRGAFSGFYPYPFIEANKIGYGQTLLNAGGLTLAFLLVALLFVAIARTLGKRAIS
jgi:hypothetical protein